MKRTLALLLVAGLTLSACETLPWPRSSEPTPENDPLVAEPMVGVVAPPLLEPGLLLSSEQRFADIPLPMGVVQDNVATYVFESKALQVGRMVYMTKAGVNELAQFYMKECPVADWMQVSVLEANGVEIVFRKPGKRLSVTIRDLGKIRGRQLQIDMIPEDDAGL